MEIIKNTYCRFILLIFIFAACNSAETSCEEQRNRNDNKYKLVENWPQLSPNYILGQVTGVGIDTSQNIFLFHRAGREWTEPFPDSTISIPTIVQLDRKIGKILNSWGANLFIMPHGLTVDKNNNVWVTDVGLHQVLKFSHDGKLLMKLGIEKTPGNDPTHFNLPTDVAVANDGSFYVSDGYGNSRIIKFSKEGKYLFEWGNGGDEFGEFNTPHGIDLDAQGNVYVADRDNNRIQRFDSGGKFLAAWKNNKAVQLYSLSIDKKNNSLLAVDYLTILTFITKGSDIIVLDSTMTSVSRFGRAGAYEGPVCRYHDITIDDEENIYVGDILGNRIQKFKKGAN